MNTALGLGVGFDKEIGIKFAGGFLVQVSLSLLGILCTRFQCAVHFQLTLITTLYVLSVTTW
jgi:hypothetical protein